MNIIKSITSSLRPATEPEEKPTNNAPSMTMEAIPETKAVALPAAAAPSPAGSSPAKAKANAKPSPKKAGPAKAKKAAAAGPAAAAKPKRPLSAFNLFYRYKRTKVLEAMAKGNVASDDIAAIVAAAPGTETAEQAAKVEEAGDDEAAANEARRANIRTDLAGNLLPRDTRDRQHRRDAGAMNGAMSFLELGRLMNLAWKACDAPARQVFSELSEEGRETYRDMLREYHDSHVEAPPAVPSKEGKGKKKKGKKKRKKDESSDDESETSEASRVVQGAVDHLRAHPAGPSLMDLLARGNAGQGLSMADALRTVSYTASQDHADLRRASSGESESGLRARVRELEGQLAAERLRARVRELEGSLARQRGVEDQLRAQLEFLSRSNHVNLNGARPPMPHPMAPVAHQAPPMPQQGSRQPPNAAPAAAQGRPQQDGLWSLVNASMIHPAVQAQQQRGPARPVVHHGFQGAPPAGQAAQQAAASKDSSKKGEGKAGKKKGPSPKKKPRKNSS